MKKLGRNEQCFCGSGLKFKQCCSHKQKNASSVCQTQEANIVVPKSIDPFSVFFELMPSIEWKGYRLRFIFNKIHYHPPLQTFHEFLFHVIKLTFCEKWWNSQKGMATENKHQVFKWFENVVEFRQVFADQIEVESTAGGSVFSAKMDGPHQALLSLGWDLYCLQAKNKLPSDIIRKIIKNKEFQSFRYEIAVAAIMVRAGFEIKWYDISGQNEKKSEFIAIHSTSGQKVTVEAKSIHHKKGVLNLTEDKEKQIAQRLKDAEEKKESGIPHIIFIDVNRPPPPHPHSIRGDVDYLKSIINKMPPLSKEKPAKHEALFLTNFVPHYGGLGAPVPKYQHFPVIPVHCVDQVPVDFYFDIFRSLDAYSFIPKEV